MALLRGNTVGLAVVVSSITFAAPALAADDVRAAGGTLNAFKDASTAGFIPMNEAEMEGQRGAGAFDNVIAALLAASGGENSVTILTSSTSDPIIGELNDNGDGSIPSPPDDSSSGPGPQTGMVTTPTTTATVSASSGGGSSFMSSFPRVTTLSITRNSSKSISISAPPLTASFTSMFSRTRVRTP